MNGFGTALRVEIFGSSHGPNLGAVVDGVPPGTRIKATEIQAALDRRRAMDRALATRRHEPDLLVVESGLEADRATGDPIRAHVDNVDVQRFAYDEVRDTPRPGHADYPARVRYGDEADLSGGGIFSGRMTVGLVIAGAIARSILEPRGCDVAAFTRSIGAISATVPDDLPMARLRELRDETELGAPDPGAAAAMARAVADARREADSLGGIVEAWARGVPVGLGEPFFDSIESEVAHLAFSIPAVKGVEFGAGFAAAGMRGSEHNDPFEWREGRVVPRTNHAGGILGGLATGAPVVLRAAIKPTSSIPRPQDTVNLRTGKAAQIVVKGRHDPCIVPRAVVVVESILAFALADLGLRGGFLP